MAGKFIITYSETGTISSENLTYVIIGARENGKWIFVRHKDRSTWELPAGHLEEGENPMDAAKRELFEETGTTKCRIYALTDYSVETDSSLKHGRIFFAEVDERMPLPDSEIAEIVISEKSPRPATYPQAHWEFMKLLDGFIKESEIPF